METGGMWTDMPIAALQLVRPEPLYTQAGEYAIQANPLITNDVSVETDTSMYLYHSANGVQTSLVGSAVAASMGTLPSNYENINSEAMPSYNHDLSDVGLYYNSHAQNVDLPELVTEGVHLADMPTTQSGLRVKTQKELANEGYFDFGGRINHSTEPQWVDCCQSAQPAEDQQSWLKQYSLCLEQARIPSSSHQQVIQKKHRLFGRKPFTLSENGGDFSNFSADAEYRNAFNQLNSYSETNEKILPTPNDIYQSSSHHSRHSAEHDHFLSMPRSRPKIWKDKSVDERDDKLSKDEKKAKDLSLPLGIEEIVNLPIDEFNEKLSKYDMSENQITLARDIRRRGKNKVAAQNCRKRKIEQISDLEKQYQTHRDEKKVEQEIHERLLTDLKRVKSIHDKLNRYLADVKLKA